MYKLQAMKNRCVGVIVAGVMAASLGIVGMASPAFAADPTTTVTIQKTESETPPANISVTVPTTIAAAAGSSGGALTFPTDAKITNNSTVPVEVSGLRVDMNPTAGASLATSAASLTGQEIYMTVNGTTLVSGVGNTVSGLAEMDADGSPFNTLPLTFTGSVASDFTANTATEFLAITWTFAAVTA